VAHVDLQHAAAQGLEDELLLLALDLCAAHHVSLEILESFFRRPFW